MEGTAFPEKKPLWYSGFFVHSICVSPTTCQLSGLRLRSSVVDYLGMDLMALAALTTRAGPS